MVQNTNYVRETSMESWGTPHTIFFFLINFKYSHLGYFRAERRSRRARVDDEQEDQRAELSRREARPPASSPG